jgi:hypothetical protein
MIPIFLAIACLHSQAQPLPADILDRPLTWDAQGLVSVNLPKPLSAQERGWISLMVRGDYVAAQTQAEKAWKEGSSDCFAVWVIAESARVRKTTRDFEQAVDRAAAKGVSAASLAFARHRLVSLALALMPIHRQGSGDPQYRSLTEQLHNCWIESRSFASTSLPNLVVLTQNPHEEPQDIRKVVRDNVDKFKPADLRLALARSMINGTVGTYYDHVTHKPLLDARGQRRIHVGAFSPQVEEGIPLCLDYLKDHPNDPLPHYYLARAYSWREFICDDKEQDKKRDRALALKEIRLFLANPDLPPILKKSGEKFLARPVPGSFGALPTE